MADATSGTPPDESQEGVDLVAEQRREVLELLKLRHAPETPEWLREAIDGGLKKWRKEYGFQIYSPEADQSETLEGDTNGQRGKVKEPPQANNPLFNDINSLFDSGRRFFTRFPDSTGQPRRRVEFHFSDGTSETREYECDPGTFKEWWVTVACWPGVQRLSD
ncbi:MAG: hypothetical protein U0804_27345 [Gemmataceae bacterium]